MWPYHKLVCGQRAHPFRLPPFSESEAEIAIDMLTAKPTDPRLIHFQAAAKQVSWLLLFLYDLSLNRGALIP